MMHWEAITAISTAITTLVLLLTVVLGRRQVELLRRSTQLDGIFRLLRQLDSVEIRESRRFIVRELPERLKDPQFVGELETGQLDEAVHKELPTMHLFEEIGAYVRFGLVDADFLYCQAGLIAVRCWKELRPVVAAMRKRLATAYDNFERFVEGAIRYAGREDPAFDPGLIPRSDDLARPLPASD